MSCTNKIESNEPACIHAHSEHLKRLQGGDHKRKSIKDETPKNPGANEFEAFLNIGAEAERRNELIIKQMECSLVKHSREIVRLQKDNCKKVEQLKNLQMEVIEKNNIIDTLTKEIYEVNHCGIQDNELTSRINYLQREKEYLVRENENLNNKIAQFTSKFRTFHASHKNCTSQEELDMREKQICILNSKLMEYNKKWKKDREQIKMLEHEICELNREICRLNSKMDAQCEQFADKSSSYQKLICDLQSQVAILEKTLFEEQEQNSGVDGCFKETDFPSESSFSKNVIERDKLVQNILSKMDQRDKSIEKYIKAKGMSAKQCEDMSEAIGQQAKDIKQLQKEFINKSVDDADTNDLLKDINQLQQDVYNTYEEPQNGINCALLRRIKRIKCRIKSRLQREQARKKEISKQINSYRCEFMSLQKEIEDFRAKCDSNSTIIKEEIKMRAEKEETISRYIDTANKRLKELQSKIESLSKGLENIVKVQDLIMNVNERYV